MTKDHYGNEITIDGVVILSHSNSRRKGFWDGIRPGDIRAIPEKIALIHSEVSEALEIARKLDAGDIWMPRYEATGKPIGFDSELADIVIRTADLAGGFSIDLARAIREKHSYNLNRPAMHGKRF